MFKTQKLKIITLLFAFYFLSSGTLVQAAELFFEARNQEFIQGDDFLASIFLNAEGESINAAEGRIVFSEELLEAKEIRDGNSIINFWIERPKVEQAGIIGLSGIVPGGYQETKGFLFSVVFRAKASGSGAIEIRDAKVLLNDGEGTPASVKLSPFQFSISQEAPAVPPTVETVKDTDPPEPFEPIIGQDPGMFEGKYFLVFVTQDKGSGINYYEILEKQRYSIWSLIKKDEWQVGESPYLLKDQKLKSYIYIKAIDKAGNERVAIVSPQNPLAWYENYSILITIILGIIIVYVVFRILWKRGRKNTK